MKATSDSFYGKTWIAKAQLILLGGLGLFSVPMGIAFWTGALKDANEQPRPEVGPPLTIIGSAFGLVALMALIRVIHLRQPVLQLYREGLEVRMVGGPGLFGLPLAGAIPYLGHAIGLIELAWGIVTLRRFKVKMIRMPWETIGRIDVEGVPMHRWLIIDGEVIGQMTPLRLKMFDAQFRVPLDTIAHFLRRGQTDVNFNKTLASWTGND
jgi:hypothetical protein